ncbi:MAG: hypothetical protein AAGG00_16450 [Cyanobacteria bacterium P01_H01_bin.150]
MRNFTITLYAFHLRHILTDSPNEVDYRESSLLWENLVKLGDSLPFHGLKDLRSKLVCYQNNEYGSKLDQSLPNDWLTDNGILNLGSITTENLEIEAELQPFLLNDTYAVDLTLFPKSPDTPISVSQLQQFKPSCLLPSLIQASIGQTLWIYGEVDEHENCQELANKYAEALLAGTNLKPVLLSQGKLFGSQLFEYQSNDPNEPQNCTKRCHILISLNNNHASTPKLLGEAYNWLINLLCCYHKIFYIYQEACQRKPQARKIYSKLNNQVLKTLNQVAPSETELDVMKDWLKQLPQDALKYNVCLRDLNAHHTSIETNIANYRTCLQKITDIGDVPSCWQVFLNRCYQWQTQIEIDINYLTPGKDLFERMIDSIRGIVEIEQAKQDRSLERTVQIVGFALGGGAMVSGVIAEHVEKPFIWLPNFKYPRHPITNSLILSILATLLLYLIALWWTKPKHKSLNSPKHTENRNFEK